MLLGPGGGLLVALFAFCFRQGLRAVLGGLLAALFDFSFKHVRNGSLGPPLTLFSFGMACPV
jgi:hypothetical protein